MWAIVLAGLVAAAAPGGKQSTLIMPISAINGAEKELAESLTNALVVESSRVLPGRTIKAYNEIAEALGVEQLRQLTDCDSNSCAAEIAGALNVDDLVKGTLSVVGTQHQLALFRIRARDASSLSRVQVLAPVRNVDQLVAEIPGLVQQLFAPELAEAGIVEPRPASSAVLPKALRIGAVGLAVLGLVPLILAGASLALVVTTLVMNGGSPLGSEKIHVYQAIAADVALGASLVSGVLVLVVGAGVAGLLVGSFVVPG